MKTKQELGSLHQLLLSANPNDWALAAAMGSKSDLERIMRLEAKRLRELSPSHGKVYLSLLGWNFLWYRNQAYWEGHGDNYTSTTFPSNLHRVKASWRKHFKQLKDNYEQD